MDKHTAAFYLVLASCAFGLSIYVSRFVGNLIVLGAYIIFVVAVIATIPAPRIRYILRDHRTSNIDIPFRYSPAILYPTIVLWAVFVVGLMLNPSSSALLRTGAFIVISGITLFVVPAVVPREQAFAAIGVLGTAFVVLGLPATVLGTPFRIAGITLSGVTPTPIHLFGLSVRSPTAIFGTQNYFRVLVALGTVASAGVFARTRNPWPALLCVLNGVGVYLTVGRAARLATIAAAGLAVVYYLAGRRALGGVTLVGILVTVVVFAGALGIIPAIGPAETLHTALSKRLAYWNAAFEAISVRPILGWGLVDTRAAVGAYFSGFYTGVHNSYLRLFLIGGVVGGVTYLIFCASALVTAFGRVRECAPLALTTYCLVIMALIFQLFAGGTVFGTSLSSVLWALTVGYAQPGIVAKRGTDAREYSLINSENTILAESE